MSPYECLSELATAWLIVGVMVGAAWLFASDEGIHWFRSDK